MSTAPTTVKRRAKELVLPIAMRAHDAWAAAVEELREGAECDLAGAPPDGMDMAQIEAHVRLARRTLDAWRFVLAAIDKA